ncbi:MAG TPA: nickel pincer cofactor biosynthesis protein LarC [Phycisphaerae bacterium]|nr:nickel pincer cofactor biosynthesis protein LarC [Phycisphaerae bacterium]HOJ72544.1 nickel pincer cofactor biosynthesis protein LarC [Phycisphaerae bacterium]HOM49795.1 nickel pincer cofactor biosynthesis protein LarC [Phycisphaerae bacterium]HON69058.1 nickel pincer cofactor biosynthesis protein LarC [Phycisphaerae bacterium]HOQ84241.1 nickel pincer cofactor biosynthesis protein LarC [Phycisphaerae bacterium]
MRIAYFDCFSGASGDMILGACISAGVDAEALRGDLTALNVPGFTLEARPIRKQGFAATQIEVVVDPVVDKPHRHLSHIRQIIEQSQLSAPVRERALAIFTRLAEAEAAVHGTTIEKVHFHEVGALDAIVDIVGASLALERLGIERVLCSPIPTGSGTVTCDHGVMPVPAPATAELLKGVPLAACDEVGELTTPTGAAILTTLASDFGTLPPMRVERIGIGAGRRDGQKRANILRLFVGELNAADEDEEDEILVLEANLDDVSGQVIGHVYDALFEIGALDVFTTPVHMKKNRPGTQLTVLAPLHLRDEVETILFAETTTFGIRAYRCSRRKLTREFETVDTPAGSIRLKVGRRHGKVVTAAPEYEDCRRAAAATGRPLKEIMEQAIRLWRAAQDEHPGSK